MKQQDNNKGEPKLNVIEKDAIVFKDHHFANLYQFMMENGDKINASKIIDLYEKKLRSHFFIHFTGHFSAGKSSLINHIIGEELLPKSPIPTSANIVKITSGDGVARVFFNNQQPVEYKEPYDIDMIKDFCMEKDTISSIEIHTSKPIFPTNSFLVDTPGIDAADDADRYMTESSLHEVDVLYFVMDYNHVQSEVNLKFLLDIQKLQIPFHIIINQIDKHDESELSFTQFKESVEETFALWQVFPQSMYFTTMKDEKHPYNQIDELKEDLFQLLEKQSNTDERIFIAMKKIIDAHKEYLQDEIASDITDEADLLADKSRYEQLIQQLKELENKSKFFAEQFSQELEQTLKNAYVMPASLRDVAGSFLESQQKDFKVGFLSAKKKTEVEKKRRLEQFLSQLNESIQTTIEWKLREKFISLLKDSSITSDHLNELIQNFSVKYDEGDALSFVKQGALLNGNYILNYTNEVSSDIKNKFRMKASELLTEIKALIDEQSSESLQLLQSEKQELEDKLAVIMQNEQLQEQLANVISQLDALLNDEHVIVEHVVTLENEMNKRRSFIVETVPVMEKNKEQQIEHYERKISEVDNKIYDKHTIIDMIEITMKEIEELPSFSNIMNELLEKKERIENRELTIALFGAFSAGKSSFSNALLGKHVLPVSPNPTTAVISRIKPVTDEHPHGTVMITYKSDEALTKDLQTIIKDFAKDFNEFNELMNWIKEENIANHEMLPNLYQSYLRALLEGFEKRKNLLGKTEAITLDHFESYVTDESIAAYIASVDLYYDCPVTEKGITLVDTPGADSVNARHTNVAFDYIKDADAIIYVTYYNHAVTSADRDFLLQLGRVKESFALDKMFFIINAADLANNDEELQLVIDYVHEQLIQFGIRNARIYPVSSKNSLEEKLTNSKLNEQMATFEKEFYQFIEHDLQLLTYQAAIWDIKRAKTQLEAVIHTATLDEQAKDKYIAQLKEKDIQAKELVSQKEYKHIFNQNEERIKRQLHYVNERFYIRFHDMFTQYFNPTTITENGKRAHKQLEKNRNQLIDYVGYELLQEVRAVSLRVESFAEKLLQQFYDEINEEIAKLNHLFTLSRYKQRKFSTPAYEQALQSIDMSIFTPALKLYKNKKQFFENNERESMKELFYDILKPELEQYVDDQHHVMKESYLKQLEERLNEMKKDIELQLTHITTQQIEAMENTIDISILQRKRDKILTVLSKIEA